MKSFLSNILLWGTFIVPLTYSTGKAQPIQLIPKTSNIPELSTPLSLPQEATGFWEGTPPSLIETYFSKLPVKLSSPILRTLRLEVLKEKYTPLLKDPSYEKTMITLLMETGQFNDAKDFLTDSTLPEKESSLINILWLEGDQKKACEKVSNLIRTSSSPEWKKQNVFCLYLNGEKERSKIAAELLKESSPEAFPLMNALLDSSSKPAFDSSIAASPFLLSVWTLTGEEMTENDIQGLNPSQLALLARSEKLPFKTRLLAASQGLQIGSFSGESVLTLLKDAPSEGLLGSFATALKTPKPDTLIPLFEKASDEHKLGIIGIVFKPLLSKIDPSQDTLLLAPFMVRAYLEAGEKDLAQKWGTFFMREAPDEAIAILPLLHLSSPQIKWGEPQLQAWQAYQSRIHPRRAAQNSYELREILIALGENPGPAMKGEPVKPSWRQEKALFDERTLELLDSAVLSKRKGEIILLILVLIGETPFADISVDKFVRLLGALHKGGYKDQANALALEYLLAKGV